PRTVGVGDQTLLICLYRDREALDVLFLEAVLMQRLERENLLEGDIQGAQRVVLAAAQAASNELLVLAKLAVRLVLVVQLKDLAEQSVVGLAVRNVVGAAEREGHAVNGCAASLQECDAGKQG